MFLPSQPSGQMSSKILYEIFEAARTQKGLDEFTFDRVYNALPFHHHQELLSFLEGVRDRVLADGRHGKEECGDDNAVLETPDGSYVYRKYYTSAWNLKTPEYQGLVNVIGPGAGYVSGNLEIWTNPDSNSVTYLLPGREVDVARKCLRFYQNRELVHTISLT